MNIAFTPKNLARVRGVRKADKATNRRSFCGVVPWFDLDNLMAPTGKRRSSKEGLIEFESLLEHDFLVLTRSDGITTSVRPQPIRFHWWDPRTSQWRVHIPDFAVMRRFVPKPVYIQVKPKAVADALSEELGLIKAAFRQRGLSYEVWTDEDIRRQPRFSNAELLFDQSGPLEDVEALDRVRKVLKEAAPSVLSVAEVREAAGIGPRAFQAILRLHMRNEVDLNLERPLDAKALVQPTFVD
ncbi:hypothetical protein [Methylobacterium haplocladii]|uniref:TnsA endonuclease N-terminal domain-containing protein n=1 Tax=Methylobacterium haplocladii TaxID=1176176 RepID=A0A512IV00_9HYPH|nr:hypothetical protein [Methylobacterium haplocladii]GEP01513.1 hypothetical protein MHA02_39000 [Methylobacterium haplocladii]GJD82302.1 hypothetical protein HPGCJGGD_0154 [Methylobacterium haplocladii]GLS59164.1 hypothetical protein GCM10007887_18300 [Methylobacterium haplocladii]